MSRKAKVVKVWWIISVVIRLRTEIIIASPPFSSRTGDIICGDINQNQDLLVVVMIVGVCRGPVGSIVWRTSRAMGGA